MVKQLITDISEEDFRRLNLVAYAYQKVTYSNSWRYEYVPVSLNDILDESIKDILENGWEDNKTFLSEPVTIAIHECNDKIEAGECKVISGYMDKFINSYSGLRTFQIGFGIKHLYSTRDYYECHDDYWRVRKVETKVIYRVYLDKAWLDKFVVKHKVEKSNIEYKDDGATFIETTYDLIDGEWVARCKTKVELYEGRAFYSTFWTKDDGDKNEQENSGTEHNN